jgi:hypothetical protein
MQSLSERIRRMNDTVEDQRLCDAAPDLVEALRWYAQPAIYQMFRQSTERPEIMDEGEIWDDGGKRAREVLERHGLTL